MYDQFAVATDGMGLDLDSLPMTIAYNADGTVNYYQVAVGSSNYRCTLTWTSGKLTGVSQWVKQ